MPTFWKVFIINRCWILSKAFSESIELIVWFLSFNLLMWFITLTDLCILKNPCIPGINPTWSWCMLLLMCCWILLKLLFKINPFSQKELVKKKTLSVIVQVFYYGMDMVNGYDKYKECRKLKFAKYCS